MNDVHSRVGRSRAQPTHTHSRVTPSNIDRVSQFMLTSAFATSTGAVYSAAVTRFLAYCPHQGHHRSPAHLDKCVIRYICRLFILHDSRNRQLAVNTVYGIYMQRPDIRGLLKGSEGHLRGWKGAVPSVSHPPVTWPIAVAIARTMAYNGWPECAVATLVAFDGLLRVGELVAITVRDVSLPHDSRRGAVSRALVYGLTSAPSLPSVQHSSSAFIRLAVTKTGSNQTAEISDPDVIALLARHMAGRSPTTRLFTLPSASPADYFRSVFRAVCQSLGMGGLGFTPHSLRHGGATHAHMHMGQTIEHVLHRGRWQSNSSARTYLQIGKAALINTQLSEQAQNCVQQLQSQWVCHLWVDCFYARTSAH